MFEIIIYKSRRRLELWENGALLKSYAIGIGKSEFGHKGHEGDLRTPEGFYRVCVKNPKSKYHLSLGLNYPNNSDALEGLRKGQISPQQYQQICEANRLGKIPSWKTPLGGEIFIHGHLELKNWSEGCIRMFNRDIEELFQLVPVGIPVTIFA